MRAHGASFEYFDHAADVGIALRADSLEGIFRSAGHALMQWIGPEPDGPPAGKIPVSVDADSGEELLVRWLQELLFLFQHQHAYFLDAENLRISAHALSGEVVCSIWDDSSCPDYREIKAVTYHQLSVRREGRSWHARVILDV